MRIEDRASLAATVRAHERALGAAAGRLASGLRVRSAADDAAGLVVAEEVRSRARGAAVAARNAREGAAMLQVADGALDAMGDLVQRVRVLALQAANGSMSAAARSAARDEMRAAIDEVDRLARTTSFGTIRLFDGSAGTPVRYVPPVVTTWLEGEHGGDTPAPPAGPPPGPPPGPPSGPPAVIIDEVVPPSPPGTAPPPGGTVVVRGIDGGPWVSVDQVVAERAWRPTGAVGTDDRTFTLVLRDRAVAVAVTPGADPDSPLDLRDRIRSALRAAGVADDDVRLQTVRVTQGTDDPVDDDVSVRLLAVQQSTDDGIARPGAAPVTAITDDDFWTSVTDPAPMPWTTGSTMGGRLRIQVDDTPGGGVDVDLPDLRLLRGELVALAGVDAWGPGTASFGAEFDGVLGRVDHSLATLSAVRGRLGAQAASFEAAAAALAGREEQLRSAGSRIDDADVAVEVAAMTRAAVLRDAAVAVQAQAVGLDRRRIGVLLGSGAPAR